MSRMSFKPDGRSLVEFWNWAGRTGRMKPSTAGVYRTACRAVLSSLGAQWESYDLTELNVESAIHNFRRANASRYDARTLDKYGSNFRKSVPSLMEFLKDPENWEAPAQPRQRPTSTNAPHRTPRPGPRVEPQVREKPTATTSFEISVPSGRKAGITLPPGLTPEDVDFMGTVFPAHLQYYMKKGD
ncbi:hypothetical protein [Streptomyces sp. AN091965]|uniref:hypothetical protein n=1 Tax=Streptomyces sp. AN091965 TaxID=2927803 RepID=UPI001F6128A0|nr:hypothetical protein [Streptomyces sp. AN091965]MCI3932829.1 hypothetical protein [Streptomyces sp. AN091965]